MTKPVDPAAAADGVHDDEAARMARLVALSSDWVWEQDEQGRLSYLSRGAIRATGRPLADMIGRRRQDMEGFDCEPEALAAYESALANGRTFRDIVYGMRALDGGMRYLRISGEPVRDEAGALRGFRGLGADVTAPTLAARRLAAMARFDELTGLPNRAQFIEELDRAVARARRSDEGFALCFIDLDGFKKVNDTHGHAAGDEVLRATAERLRQHLRETDFVARLGGDEFVALLSGASAAGALAMIGQKILDALREPIAFHGRPLGVRGSIGVALYPSDGTQARELLELADAAMYQAKQQGKDCLCFYTAELARSAAQQFALELDLRQSFASGGLELHFQPRFELAGGAMSAMEALVRWDHPQRGAVPPAEFVALAEERGLMTQLGRWVLDAACRQVARWRAAGLTPPRCAINLSAQQFDGESLLDDVRAALQRHQLEPACLELEIGEALLTAQRGRADALLHKLSEIGVALTIDDFGTATSSLSLMQRCPAQRLKVDLSFVGGLPGQEASAVTRAAIALAHGMGMRAVAEGVENDAQMSHLRELGCDEAQGYLLGRPQPADAFAALLAR